MYSVYMIVVVLYKVYSYVASLPSEKSVPFFLDTTVHVQNKYMYYAYLLAKANKYAYYIIITM